jgi:ethanolamine utilization cobalamin adenosyltransferase
MPVPQFTDRTIALAEHLETMIAGLVGLDGAVDAEIEENIKPLLADMREEIQPIVAAAKVNQ